MVLFVRLWEDDENAQELHRNCTVFECTKNH